MLRTVARFSNLDVEDWIDCALGPNWVKLGRILLVEGKSASLQ